MRMLKKIRALFVNQPIRFSLVILLQNWTFLLKLLFAGFINVFESSEVVKGKILFYAFQSAFLIRILPCAGFFLSVFPALK